MRNNLSLIVLLFLLCPIFMWAAGEKEAGTASEDLTWENAPVVDIYWDGDLDIWLKERDYGLKDNPWYRYVFEKTGVKPRFTWIPFQGYGDKMRLVVASKEDFDLFRGDQVVNWMKNKSLEPLDNLLEKHGQDILNTVPKESLAKVSHKGQIYGVPIPEHRIVKQILMIRKDWLDKIGMDIPDTIEEFEEYLRAVRTIDFDGNGEKDEYGLSMDMNWADTFCFTGAWGASPSWSDKGSYVDFDKKEIVLWVTTDEARPYFQTFAKWWEEGLIDPESLSQDRYSGQKAKFSSGKVGIYRDSIVDCSNMEASLTEVLGPGPRVVPMPPMKGTEQGGYMNNPIIDRAIFMSRYAGDKEAAIKFCNFFMTEEGLEFVNYGVEGIDYKMVDGNIERASWGDREFLRQFGRFASKSREEYYDDMHQTLLRNYGKFIEDSDMAAERAQTGLDWHMTAFDWGFKGYWEWQDDIIIADLPSAKVYPDWMSPLGEYRLKFLTGMLDAGDDGDWNAFLKAMESAGAFKVLEEATEVWFDEVYSENPGLYDQYK